MNIVAAFEKLKHFRSRFCVELDFWLIPLVRLCILILYPIKNEDACAIDNIKQ